MKQSNVEMALGALVWVGLGTMIAGMTVVRFYDWWALHAIVWTVVLCVMWMLIRKMT